MEHILMCGYAGYCGGKVEQSAFCRIHCHMEWRYVSWNFSVRDAKGDAILGTLGGSKLPG